MTASGPFQGDDTDRQGKGGNEMVGSEGDRLGECKSKGGRDVIRIRIRIGDRHGRGGGTELRQGESGSSGAEWSGSSVDQWEVNSN